MDANVVVKWILSGEPYEEKAIKLMVDQLSGTCELCAPSFIAHEVANSVWKAIKLKRITQEDAHKALQSLDDLRVNLDELNWTEVSSELAIASKLDIAIYDASYLFLSEKVSAPVITADDKLYQKAKGHFRLLHLKDYV